MSRSKSVNSSPVKKNRGRIIPPVKREECRKLILQGMTAKDAAAKVGIDHQTACKIQQEVDIKLKAAGEKAVNKIATNFASLTPEVFRCANKCFKDKKATHHDTARWGMIISRINGLITEKHQHSGKVDHAVTWAKRAATMNEEVAERFGITVAIPTKTNGHTNGKDHNHPV